MFLDKVTVLFAVSSMAVQFIQLYFSILFLCVGGELPTV